MRTTLLLTATLLLTLVGTGAQESVRTPTPAVITPADCDNTPLPEMETGENDRRDALARLVDYYGVAPELIDQLLPMTYCVVAESEGKTAENSLPEPRFASGTMVANRGSRLLITVGHLVTTGGQPPNPFLSVILEDGRLLPLDRPRLDPPFRVRARDYRGNIFCCTLLRIDIQRDVAAFSVEGGDRVLPETIAGAIATASPTQREPVIMCANLWGGPVWRTANVLAEMAVLGTDLGTRIDMIKADGPILPGFSGGPVFSLQGKLVGVCASGDTQYSFFADPRSLQKLLE